MFHYFLFAKGPVEFASHIAEDSSLLMRSRSFHNLSLCECHFTEAFPWNEAPRYLIRDRDCVYGAAVTRRLRAMGIRDTPIAPGSPWQNGFAESRRACVRLGILIGENRERRAAWRREHPEVFFYER